MEVFLVQVVIYSLLWIADDYIATFLSVIFAAIALFILLISLLVELIEPSKVPRFYYYYIVSAIIAPVITGVLMVTLKGGMDWFD